MKKTIHDRKSKFVKALKLYLCSRYVKGRLSSKEMKKRYLLCSTVIPQEGGGGRQKGAWKRLRSLHKKRDKNDLNFQAEVIFHPRPDL